MARVSAKGGFHLLWGLVLSTVISAVGTIIIARLLGSDNYGLYAIALAAPNLISIFRDWGINTAMIKYSAEYYSENNVAKIRSVFVSGTAFEIIVGVSLSVLSLIFSQILSRLLRTSSNSSINSNSFIVHLNRGTIEYSKCSFHWSRKDASKQHNAGCSIIS